MKRLITTVRIPGQGKTQTHSRQRGFSLIEVMISILVLAIGLLGIAGLLTVTLRNAQSSSAQNQATIQSYAMLDALRANKPAAIIGQYDLTQYTCSEPASDNRIGSEQAGWIRSLQAQVAPSACGRIQCTSLTCTVSVRWDDSRASGGSNTREYVLTTRI